MGAVTARAAGVDEVVVARAAAPGHPRRRRAVRRRRGLRDGRRAGDRGARARDGVGAARRRHRRAGQPLRAGGQAAGERGRRDRRLRRAERPLRDPVDGRRPGAGRPRTCWRRPSTGRTRSSWRSATTRRCSTAAPRRRRRGRSAEDLEAALAFAEALAPEHLQLMGAAAEALAPRVRRAGCLFVGRHSGTAFGDYVAGSNHIAADRGGGALRLRAQRPPLPPPHGRGAHPAPTRLPSSPPPARRSPAPRASRPTPRRWRQDGRIQRHEPHRGGQPHDGGDRRLPEPRPRRLRRRDAPDRRRLPRPHARPAGPPRPPRPRGAGGRRPPDRLAPHGRGHGHRARPGARPRARRPRRHHPLRPRRRPDGRGARGLRDRRLRAPVLRLRRADAAAGRHRAASSTRRRRSSSAPWRARRG